MTLPRLGLREKTVNALRPLEPRQSFKWITKYIRSPQQHAKAFNPYDYPWTKGICYAYDLDSVRQISMQFAARLGKTFLANSLMIRSLEHDPATAMCGMPDEKILKKMIRDNYYKMLERCVKTRRLVPREADRIQTRLEFAGVNMYGAWAGSPSTLADLDPLYKHGGEIDKWTKRKSDEADPFLLFKERGLEHPSRKSIFESTPQIEHNSRIEQELITGWNCTFKIPCPHCGTLIKLITGEHSLDHRKKIPGGIIFDIEKGAGHADPNLAFATARYQCQACHQEWHDDQRRQAIQKGIWIPEGCEKKPTKADFARGIIPGEGDNASFQLGRLYAPTFTFGDHAKEIANCLNDPDRWQNYFNSWAGETYRRRRAVMTWETVGARLKGDYEYGTVPSNVQFLTNGIDVQKSHFVYVCSGWAARAVGYVIALGICDTIEQLKEVIFAEYEHLDGGPRISPVMTLIDSGEGQRQDEIVDLCEWLNRFNAKISDKMSQQQKAKAMARAAKQKPWIWPSKGSSGNIKNGWPYDKKPYSELVDKNSRRNRDRNEIEGFEHVTVNTPVSQTWLNSALYFREPGRDKSLSIPIGVEEDEDFLKQIINEAVEDKVRLSGHKQPLWVVVDEQIPVDFRDSLRYSKTGADVVVRNKWTRLPQSRTLRMSKKKPVSRSKPSKQSSKSYIRGAKKKSGKKKTKRFLR